MPPTWYAVFDPTDPAAPNRLVSVASQLPARLPPGLVAAPIAGPLGEGQAWDPATRTVVEAPPDPALGDQPEWYAYVDDTGDLVDAGPDPDPPEGLTAVRLRPFPSEWDAWDSGARRYGPRRGVRAMLEQRLFQGLQRQLEAVQFHRDAVAALPVSAERKAAIEAALDARLVALRREQGRMLTAYARATG